MESADLSPLRKQAKLSPNPAEALPSSILAKIFSYLPFKDRHQLCLVSSSWSAASRIPWSDVKILDLASVPRAMVDSILALCPGVKEIYAKNLTIILDKKSNAPISANVHTMKLRNVRFAVRNLSRLQAAETLNLFAAYFKRFPNLAELTLIDVACMESVASASGSVSRARYQNELLVMPRTTAASLRRLMFVRTGNSLQAGETPLYPSLQGLSGLECVFWEDNSGRNSASFGADLPNLREVCLAGRDASLRSLTASAAPAKFPSLEVLVFASGENLNHRHVAQLLRSSLKLRVLILSGCDEDLELDHRVHEAIHDLSPSPTILPPRGVDDGSTLPPLQMFVGGDITKHVRFTLPANLGATTFWRIDSPMNEYLAKPEVAAVFRDVWVAKILREGAESGLVPWGHPDKLDLFYSTAPLLFC